MTAGSYVAPAISRKGGLEAPPELHCCAPLTAGIFTVGSLLGLLLLGFLQLGFLLLGFLLLGLCCWDFCCFTAAMFTVWSFAAGISTAGMCAVGICAAGDLTAGWCSPPPPPNQVSGIICRPHGTRFLEPAHIACSTPPCVCAFLVSRMQPIK